MLPCFLGIKNSVKNLIVGENSLTIHAEINALEKIMSHNKNHKKLNLLVIRTTTNGKLCSSRPCYHCLERLESSNIKIKNVYYSTSDNIICKEKFSKMKESFLTYISRANR